MKKQTKFRLDRRNSIWSQDSTAAVNCAYAKEVCDIATLPIEAIEQYGSHRPCGSDSLNAMSIAEAVARKSGIMILACPIYGSHPTHHWGMPGTIPLTFETYVGLLTDIVRGAANVGFSKSLITPAHGQTMSMFEAVYKLGIEGYFTIGSTWYDFLRDNKKTLDTFMWYVDEAETSMALSLYPDKVCMDLTVPGKAHSLIDSKWKTAPGQAAGEGMLYHSEGAFSLMEKDDLSIGVIGDPTNASKERGDKIVEKYADLYCELLEEVKMKYPCNVNPLGFRNPLGCNGTNNIQYDTMHDEHGNLKK